jgi:pimeloyl-ACP methyl ester carboxylesterase
MQRWSPVIAGLGFAAGALIAAPLAGVDVSGLSGRFEGQVTWLTLFAGVMVTAVTLWWLMVSRPNRQSLRRGAVTGALVGLCSYPVVLLLAELTRGGTISDPWSERLLNVAQFTGLTLITTGFASATIMAIVGVLLALLLRRAFPRQVREEARGLLGRLFRAASFIMLAVVVLLLAAFVWLSLLPIDPEGLARRRSASAPAQTHEQALAAYDAVRAREATMPLHPRCGSMLLTHGTKVAKAVVFFHGFTNCPAQFDELAQQLFELGYNVYVPLLPRHGEADRMTIALAGLTGEELVATADNAIDLARGLGQQVMVAGLSGGGTMAAWAAQHRADADGTIAIAPFLGPHIVPFWANRAATNLLHLLPNLMMPWDPQQPLGPEAMDYAYPRYATHALAQFMRLGEILGDSAARSKPLAPGLGMLINDADFAVSNTIARRLVAAWQRQGREVDVEVLPLSLGLIHDLIDPRQPEADTAAVYPILIDMIERQLAGEVP